MDQVNSYIDSVFSKQDTLLEEVVASIKENGMPSISVSPSSGKLLTLLISISGAKDVLEIGALGGYSGICLARGFGRGNTHVSGAGGKIRRAGTLQSIKGWLWAAGNLYDWTGTAKLGAARQREEAI